MYHLENSQSHLNLNYLNENLYNRFLAEANINYDIEHSEKSLSLEVNPICSPHLIEKNNCIKPEIYEKNEGIVDGKNIIVNDKVSNKGKSFHH